MHTMSLLQFTYIVTIFQIAAAFSSNDLGLQLSPPTNSKNAAGRSRQSTSLDMSAKSPYKPSTSGNFGSNLPAASGPASAMAGAMLGGLMPGAAGSLAGSAIQTIGEAAAAKSDFDGRNSDYVNLLGLPCKDVNSKFCQLSTTTTTTTFPMGPLERKRKERAELEEEENARARKSRMAELNRNPYVDGWFGESIENDDFDPNTAEDEQDVNVKLKKHDHNNHHHNINNNNDIDINNNINNNKDNINDNKDNINNIEHLKHVGHSDLRRSERKNLRKRPSTHTPPLNEKLATIRNLQTLPNVQNVANYGNMAGMQQGSPVPLAYQIPYQLPTLSQLPPSQAVVYRGPVQRAIGGLFGMQTQNTYPPIIPVNSIPTVTQNKQQAMNIARTEMSKARTQNTQLRWEGFNKAHETTMNVAQQAPQMLQDNRQDILKGAYGVAKNKLQAPQYPMQVPNTHPQMQIPHSQFTQQNLPTQYNMQQNIPTQQLLTQLPLQQTQGLQNNKYGQKHTDTHTHTQTHTNAGTHILSHKESIQDNNTQAKIQSLQGAQAPSPNNDILSKLGIPLYDNGADKIMHGSSQINDSNNTA